MGMGWMGMGLLGSISAALALGVACGESTGARDGSGEAGGTSGASAGGSGGDPSSGDAGASDAGAPNAGATAGGAGGAGGAATCDATEVTTTLAAPTVLILLDGSSSMFERSSTLPLPWDMVKAALMDPADGVVPTLAGRVRFGFANYRGVSTTGTEDDPACADIARVPCDLENYAAIDAVYAELRDEPPPAGSSWETPTGHAVRRATADLVAESPEPAGAKYLLLITDGNPNTCEVSSPQCGQDVAIAAVQEARAQGIPTFAVGVGDVTLNPNTGCNPQSTRCGAAHLQDVANAGLGLPVQAPPASYVYEPCPAAYGGVLLATYAESTSESAPYFMANNVTAVRAAVRSLLAPLLSCTVEMNVRVEGDATLGAVHLDDESVPYDLADGWQLEPDAFRITLHGSACTAFKDGAALAVEFPCTEPGEPALVVPR